MKMKEVTVVYI